MGEFIKERHCHGGRVSSLEITFSLHQVQEIPGLLQEAGILHLQSRNKNFDDLKGNNELMNKTG